MLFQEEYNLVKAKIETENDGLITFDDICIISTGGGTRRSHFKEDFPSIKSP